MAENVKSLRRRLRSIKNTKQITRAMEMVSAAKLRRAQEMLMAARPFAAKLQEVLGRLAGSGSIEHPYLVKRAVRKRTLVLVTADRGLAGSFNAQLIKKAEQTLRESADPMDLVCVGKKGYDYFKSRPYPIAFFVTDLAGKLSSERSNEVADRLVALFTSGETDEIVVLFNTFVSMLVFRPTLSKLLPLDPESLLTDTAGASAAKGTNTEYLLEPDPQAVLSSLLPRYIKSKIYIVLAETFAAEHSARMVAMSSATKNCEELIQSVSLAMNKARQAAITKEILEIVGGAEALKG
jgi:F-type H+-transporting ATPase subunit gamma